MESISPSELHALTDAYILDVREPAEVTEVRVAESHPIPMGTLVERMTEIPQNQTVYVMCHVGGRSAKVTQYLAAQGFNAVNVEGGIEAWAAAGLPVVTG